MALLQHLLGRAIFPARYAWFLEGRWRRLVLSPERLQQYLGLSPELTVLEIGAGGGYYARPLSRLVRRFVALDVQAEMLKRLRGDEPGGGGVRPAGRERCRARCGGPGLGDGARQQGGMGHTGPAVVVRAGQGGTEGVGSES